MSAGCGRHGAATVTVPPTPSPAAGPPPAAPPSTLPQPFEPGVYSEQGVASWYGLPFNGRRASNGEVFDMTQPVAAHRTLPFGSMVRVTNLVNGLSVEVRIIDRGPFVANRIIDLSQAAAQAINMIGPGTASVRVDLLSSPLPLAGIFSVQVGAFQQRENAERLRAAFAGRYPVTIQEFDLPSGHFYRVRIGRESTQAAAQHVALVITGDAGIQQTFVVRIDDPLCCRATIP